MLLHEAPAVQAPKPIIITTAIFLAVFFFYFTRPQQPSNLDDSKKSIVT